MNDGMLLQINRQRNLIPEELLRAAQSVQERERAAGKTPRPLLEILATRGDLDSTTVHAIRNLMHRGNPEGNGADATVVEGFHAVVESRILPPPQPPAPSSKGWPQEVVDAAADVRNLFGQFVLVAQVGSGGSGIVYRAWDRRVSRYSGLKILHTMEPSALERFTREARIAGNLQHPSIATIYEVGEHEGRYYIAMKYIDGKPIDSDPRSIPECLALIRDACRALDYAHKQGIIHRDIKPANLLVDGEDRVYVTDFGIAKQAAHEHTSTLSITGTIIGTPKYLPPEQARGEAKRADARSDVYSVGATLYTLLAGRPPFPSSNVWETLESVMKREPPALTSLNAAVSPELERIIAKAMAKDPANRFASAGELADELDRILQQRRYTGRYGLLRYLARKWVVAAGVGVLVGLLLHWQAWVFFPETKYTAPPQDLEVTYRIVLQRFLPHWNASTPPRTDSDIQTLIQKVEPIEMVVRKNKAYLPGQVLMARAAYLTDRKKALEDLQGLQGQGKQDYRIGFLAALAKLEAHVESTVPPLPAPEAPSYLEEWTGSLPALPEDLNEDSFKVPGLTDISPVLALEREVDVVPGAALAAYIRKDWNLARREFASLGRPSYVYWKIYHRATYYARKWKDTLDQGVEPQHGTGSCRECFGAALGLALEDDVNNPIPALEKLVLQAGSDPATELMIRACIARRAVERGIEPPADVPSEAQGELRGVLRIATLRWKSLTGEDEEDEYRKASQELLHAKTWMGRLARIEGLLSLARRYRLRNVEYKNLLEEALKQTADLPNGIWTVPRVLRGEANLLLGLFELAQKDLPMDLKSRVSDFRAHLLWSELYRRRQMFDQASDFANRAGAICPDHPVADYLHGAAELEKAQTDPNPGPGAWQASEYLSVALTKRPGYIEAHLARACASFLVADWAALSPVHATSCRLSAEQDLKAVLAAVPNLAPALTLQKHLKDLLRRESKGASK